MSRNISTTKFLRFTALISGAIFIAAICASAQEPAESANLDRLLLEAVYNRDRMSVWHLLARGANIEATHEDGETPLIIAAANGDAGMVKLLLERGASIHAHDQSEETALVKAARFPNPEIAKMLLDRKPTLAETNQALLLAAQGAPLAIAINGAEGGDKYDETEETSDRGNAPYAEVVGLLLDAGADIEAKDDGGNTPLMNAASYGATLVAKLLLARGADINATDPDGGTALMAAACACGVIDKPDTTAALKLLLDRRAPLEAKDKDGNTALMAAAISGRSDHLELLLRYGADINARDRNGNTALMVALKGAESRPRTRLKRCLNMVPL